MKMHHHRFDLHRAHPLRCSLAVFPEEYWMAVVVSPEAVGLHVSSKLISVKKTVVEAVQPMSSCVWCEGADSLQSKWICEVTLIKMVGVVQCQRHPNRRSEVIGCRTPIYLRSICCHHWIHSNESYARCGLKWRQYQPGCSPGNDSSHDSFRALARKYDVW